MRSLIYIVLSLNLMMSTIGMTVNKHYCMSLLRAVTLSEFDESECCGDEEPEDGCCHDETEYVKALDDYSFSNITFSFDFIPVFLQTFMFEVIHFKEVSDFLPEFNIPPPKHLRLHVLNNVFLN